jgi:hypothetical protein
VAEAEERLPPRRQQRVVVHRSQRDAFAAFAGQGIVAEHQQRLLGRNPAQGQGEEHVAHLVQTPLGAGEEAVAGGDMLAAHHLRGEGDGGDGAPAQAVDPASHQHGEVGGTGRVEAGGKCGEQGEERVR